MNSLKSRMIAAFAAVYLIWGSTYLAIRFTLEAFPPFSFAGLRFFIAGVIMYVFSRWRMKERPPLLEHWKSAFILGGFLLLGGNGLVVRAEKTISSGLAALLVATVPLWMVMLQWLWLKGKRPPIGVITGIAIGLLGVWFLMTRDFLHFDSNHIDLGGVLLLMTAAFSWSIGSVYSSRLKQPAAPFLATGMQMMAGGILLLLVGLMMGESFTVQGELTWKPIAAFFYLIFFGSLIGFTAYIWLLKNAGVSRASTYAFVNPVVAVFLGWVFAGEKLSFQIAVGAFLIVIAVIMITLNHQKK